MSARTSMPDAPALIAHDQGRSIARGMPDVRQLYTEYGDRVYRWALRYLGGNVAWAEDTTQDIFVGLLDKLPELRDADDLGGWFYRITANRCLSQLRRDRLLRALPLMRAREGAPSSPPTPEALLSERVELRQAMAAVGELPPKERVAFCMHHLDGMGQQEVGDVLGYSKSYVCKLLMRSASRLRETGWRIDHA